MMTKANLWTAVLGLLIAASAACSSEAGDEPAKEGDGAAWHCQESADVAACTCYFEVPEGNYVMEVAECTSEVTPGGRCCTSGPGAPIPNCTCIDYPNGCPDGTTEVAKCSGMAPPAT